METYVCDSCGQSIPIANQTIHSIRCPRSGRQNRPQNSSESNEASTTGEAQPSLYPIAQNLVSAQMSVLPSVQTSIQPNIQQTNQPRMQQTILQSWICSRCTFLNESHTNLCDMCGADHVDIEDSFDGDSCNGDQSAGVRNRWSCPTCTFENAVNNHSCTMCQTIRPPIPSAAETLISPDQDSEAIRLRRARFEAAFEDVFDAGPTVPFEQRADSLESSMLLGAGLGAGFALLNNSSVTNGALTGAGVGAIGNLVFQELLAAQERNRQRPPRVHRELPPYFFAARPGLGGMFNVDGLSYEQLLERFPQPARGVDDEVLDSLPVSEYTPTTQARGGYNNNNSSSSSSSSRAGSAECNHNHNASNNNNLNIDSPSTQCSICLGSYAAGDSVKSLPCLHRFHAQCVDTWLRQHDTCPICKYQISG
mmetsp:Transcript_1452/g.3072  ORF Transcript_1452/g.3072 Transcript_1452/m.3072 type:complete len:422 (+) Transcript_1452:78-1343(+)